MSDKTTASMASDKKPAKLDLGALSDLLIVMASRPSANDPKCDILIDWMGTKSGRSATAPLAALWAKQHDRITAFPLISLISIPVNNMRHSR